MTLPAVTWQAAAQSPPKTPFPPVKIKIENVNIRGVLPVFNIKIKKKILHHHITFSFSLIMNCDISQTVL